MNPLLWQPAAKGEKNETFQKIDLFNTPVAVPQVRSGPPEMCIHVNIERGVAGKKKQSTKWSLTDQIPSFFIIYIDRSPAK